MRKVAQERAPICNSYINHNGSTHSLSDPMSFMMAFRVQIETRITRLFNLFYFSVLYSVCFYSHKFILLEHKKNQSVKPKFVLKTAFVTTSLPLVVAIHTYIHMSLILFCFHYNFGEII